MPTYSYKCDSCTHIFEELLSISDRKVPEGKPCPECGKKKVRRYFSSMPGFVHEPGNHLKVDDGWRDKLKEMKKTYKINNIKEH